MLDQMLKLILSKVDPEAAKKFIEHCSRAMETQERAAKAQEEIALALRDLVEIEKKAKALTSKK